MHKVAAGLAAWVLLALAFGCAFSDAGAGAPQSEGASVELTEEQILAGADERIEKRRKADATVRVVDAAGKPLPGVRVKVEQLSHEFLFGCNAFPVLGYEDPRMEGTYQREFTALLNYATLGFYWGAYEAEEGKPNAADLRRQAEWCRDHGIATKGHPLVWHEVYPEWGPSDPDETRERLRTRVAEIVSGFAGLIGRWDVVNEATVSANVDNGVGHWAKRDGAAAMVGESLRWARAANPNAILLYNDFNVGPDFEKLVTDLIAADAPFDAIGIQSHMHGGEWPITKVWETCETYARFGKPLHFTETTVLSGEHGWERTPWPTTPEGEAFQADYVEKLYTVLFSHPAVEAITWWDFMDGAWQGAPAGLVHADLTPKPVYERLMKLVKGKWWTNLETQTDEAGVARFRGFLGHYRVTVSTPTGDIVREIDVGRGADNALTVRPELARRVRMSSIVLDRAQYRDKVHACWLGKNIGGTLGAPYEGPKHMNNLTFYDPVPTEPSPNDDLDLQLVWLKMLEDRGAEFGLPDFADYWMRYLRAYPWNEYGFCMRNLERGLRPPVSGWFENYYVDEMGSPIRSEIWACVAPADPQRAAAYAWMDSAMDHAGGEGMWGEMFWAAVESAAFVLDDPLALIRIGLAMIPPSCDIARVIREAVWLHQNGVQWAEARDRIVRIYGNDQPCNAIQNHGFTVLGWLYGRDFGDKLCKAVNCGYDTDCTGATLGALLGILGGTNAIPREWSDPVGQSIVLHKFTGAFDAPRSIAELTERTVAVAQRLMPADSTVAFGDHGALPEWLVSLLSRNEQAAAATSQDLRAAVARDGDVEITLHYHGDPVLLPGVARTMSVSCRRSGRALRAQVNVETPAGWQVRATGSDTFEVTPSAFEGVERLRVTVSVEGEARQAEFAVLSPSAAPGFPSATNIEYCPVCKGRKGSCICEQAKPRQVP